MDWILKLYMVITFFIGIASMANAEPKKSNGSEKKLELYNKVPKSLFLIKKAKISSEVGEPAIDLKERQLGLVNYDERFDRD